jgi:hypothetical protein
MKDTDHPIRHPRGLIWLRSDILPRQEATQLWQLRLGF